MNFPQRKRIRLAGYDYSQGAAYFCTICVHRAHRHKDLLARINGNRLIANRFGKIVEQCWDEIPLHRANVVLDEFGVMPNHIHLVLFLDGATQTAEALPRRGWPQADSLGAVMGSFKAAVTGGISALRGEQTFVWQERFHDHIIRDEAQLTAIRRYIIHNPGNWINDRCHPAHPDFELAWQGIAPHQDFEAP